MSNVNAIYRVIKPNFDYDCFDKDVDVETSDMFADVMDRAPYDFQLRARSILARMSHPGHPLHPASVLLVRPTGGGKSSVRDCHAHVLAGFTLTIVPLLSLGADQTEKMKPFSKDATGLLHPIHLDDYRREHDRKALVENLLSLSVGTKQTVLLFSSPQAIVGSKAYQGLIVGLISSGLLRFVCIDEIHLFVQFGLSFRDEFAKLRQFLFDLLRLNQYREGTRVTKKLAQKTKAPILWMTATASHYILLELEQLTGVSICHDPNTIDWPDAAGMYDATVSLDVRYSDCAIRVFKERVFPVLKENRTFKYIWYTNNLYSVENNTENLLLAIDSDPDIKCDVVPLTGDYIKEQKMWLGTAE
jgi:hypothetical protein